MPKKKLIYQSHYILNKSEAKSRKTWCLKKKTTKKNKEKQKRCPPSMMQHYAGPHQAAIKLRSDQARLMHQSV